MCAVRALGDDRIDFTIEFAEGLTEMTNTDIQFAGSIPELYNRWMVPLIFAEYAEDLAARVSALAPDHVLETAAGTGVVGRALVGQLPPEARYTVTDLNQPMLDFARTQQGPDPRISWRVADALALPFDEAAFDVAICQFGAMFFPDRTKGYAEARRVLKAGGHFIFSVWDRIENNVFTETVENAVGGMFPDDPPRFFSRKPHGYFDVDQIERDLRAAGFDRVAIESLEKTSPAASAREAAIALCQGTPLRNEIEARGRDFLEPATEAAARALAADFGQGPILGKIRAHVITAQK
jgi:ubiquinone/menaquinone biosynthesis C-methylase UbiE